MTTQGELLWRPTPQSIRDSALTRFRLQYAPQCPDSEALQQWSVAQPADFWQAVWEFTGVVGERGGGSAVDSDPDVSIRDTRFFPEASINCAENLLAGGDKPGAAPVAVIALDEAGNRQELTWQQLRQQVASCQQWLSAQGVGPGDCVAAWVPNTSQALVAMLAANGLGAVFTSTSPDFGTTGALDRFVQVAPTVLIAATGYYYGGKRHDRRSVLAEIAAGLPGLAAVALAGDPTEHLPSDIAEVPITDWQEVVGSNAGEPTFLRQPLATAGLVLYSSGTTGKPKCIVHSAAGVLLKQLSEHQLHCDISPGDRVFYYTTCGWMMWNWLVTALASGATIVLYDGSPVYPDPGALWRMAADEQVTLFGTSAKFIDGCVKAGIEMGDDDKLTALRTIASTGSPLSAEGFAYVYRSIKSDVHLASISGGTDLCGCFVIGNPTVPVYAGEIQGPALGCAVDVWSDTGESLRHDAGVRGELICASAFPSMPLAFAQDPDGSRYSAAYFERFPGVWAHGDFASWTQHGGLVIHGRSDATLNAGGVRIGTAEIYRQVEQFPEVIESLAIGQEWDDDTRIVLFVRLAAGKELTEGLLQDIRSRLRTECSPRHVPARVVAVTDLPRTRSGKLAELAVADAVHGREVRNTGALANPESLALFTDVVDLRS